MKTGYIFSYILFLLPLFLSCEKDMSPLQREALQNPLSWQPSYTNLITGQVVLENQSEHSNCLIYIDSLDRGTGTDSSGFYSLQFSDEDTIYTGIFTVYYFLYDYNLDSASIKVVNGKVQLDTCDVDSTGKLQLKNMEQILLVDGWTNRQEYKIGDTLIFTARFTNLTNNRTIHIFIPSIFAQLGHIIIACNYSIPYSISPDYIITGVELDLYLHPDGIWTGTEGGYIPAGQRIGNVFYPLLPSEYIVLNSYQIKIHQINYTKDETFYFS